MAEYNDEKTVVVERDGVDRSSPVGWILLIVALLVIAFFLLLGGADMFNNNANDTTDTTESSLEDTVTPSENVMPGDVDSTAPSGSDTTPAPTPEQ